MRNQLVSYIDLLFAGNPGTEEIKQEILQNTLDRYDDLIGAGKTPEAAYSLAISGIGDIGEILGGTNGAEQAAPVSEEHKAVGKTNEKLMSAIAVALYILCPVPVMIFQDALGVCLLLVLVALATGLLIFVGRGRVQAEVSQTPQNKLRRSVYAAINACAVAVYLVVSFMTGAWFITWLIFPIMGAIKGLVNACMDLKEGR